MTRKYLIIPILLVFLLPQHFVLASSLTERLSGHILLQVQANGEAWYVYPVNRLRYYLGRPADAFAIMRNLGLGVSENDFQRFQNNSPSRLLGRIMLRVEAKGEAYYVDQLTKKFVYLGRPADAFRIMREKGLGITNANLSQMPVSGASVIPPNDVLNIVVNQPTWNQGVASPLTVSGQARVFENTVNIRLRNSNNRILAETFATAQSPDIGQFGPYSKSINFTNPETDSGFLEVFSQSAKDGTDIDKTIVLVRFSENSFSGTVTDLNLDAMVFDGPALVTVRNSGGVTSVIAVPSMGLPLCKAFESIGSVSLIDIGDQVSVAGTIDTDGRIVPCENSSDYLRITKLVRSNELGFEFTYQKAPDGLILLNDTESQEADFVSGYLLFDRKEYEAFQKDVSGREGPPAIHIRTYQNQNNYSASDWAENKPLESNIQLAINSPMGASLDGNNASFYTVDGLYLIDTYIVARGQYAHLITGSYLDKESSIYKEFQKILNSFKFIN